MLDAGLSILEKYGVFGFLVIMISIGCAWLIRTMIVYFISAIENSTKQNHAMSAAFAKSIDGITKALNEGAIANAHLADATQNVVDGFDRMAGQNREEHTAILRLVESRRLN